MTSSMAKLDLRPARPEDEGALLRFAAALPGDDPARAVIAGWWRYAASHPSGLRAWVAAAVGAGEPEHVAAFLAARGVPARIDGNQTLFGEVLAATVHPDDRRSVRGPRLLAQLLHRHLEAHSTQERDFITYALASDDDWRLMRHGFELEILRRQPELIAPVAPVAPVAPGQPGPAGSSSSPGAPELPDGVRLTAAFDARVLALYERCSAPWRASCVRDAATLAWRFPDEGPYQRLVAGGDEGELAGVAVVAPSPDGHLELLDWMVPEDEHDARDRLHRALVALAQALSSRWIRADLPPWSPDFLRFQERGFRVRPTRDFLLAGSSHPKLDAFWLREHWWFQPFDVARPVAAAPSAAGHRPRVQVAGPAA